MTNLPLIYKLYGVDKNKLESFLNSKGVIYDLTQSENDFLLKFILTNELNDNFYKDFLLKFKGFIYAQKEISLTERLIEILNMRSEKIGVAESFTGGLISSLITSVSGASKVFYGGIVAYSNEAKISKLLVSEKTLKANNPVSKEVAYEMCKGMLNDCDIAISTTGIAGPNSDDSNYPVGLCYIAVGSKKKIEVNKFTFKGNRQQITNTGSKTALFLAVKALIDCSFDV